MHPPSADMYPVGADIYPSSMDTYQRYQQQAPEPAEKGPPDSGQQASRLANGDSLHHR